MYAVRESLQVQRADGFTILALPMTFLVHSDVSGDNKQHYTRNMMLNVTLVVKRRSPLGGLRSEDLNFPELHKPIRNPC